MYNNGRDQFFSINVWDQKLFSCRIKMCSLKAMQMPQNHIIFGMKSTGASVK